MTFQNIVKFVQYKLILALPLQRQFKIIAILLGLRNYMNRFNRLEWIISSMQLYCCMS